MRKSLLTVSICCILSFVSTGQTKHVIAVIGSSSAQGVGANPIDSSWVNLAKAYFKHQGLIDTIYNIAFGGSTTYIGMPTGFTPPAVRPAPDPAYNITTALSYNPDLVIVAYASNDAAGDFTVHETMSNLRTIYQTVIDAGKICYITTTQPRSLLAVQQDLLKEERDSVLKEFPVFGLNFYSPLVAADSLNPNPIYNSGDGIHPNNAGHQVLFQVVRDSNILSSFIPLALTLDAFTARPEQQDVLLQWTSLAAGPALFVIQRSQDGVTFADLGQDNGPAVSQNNGSSASPGTEYSWKDMGPLPGRSYYRLKTDDAGAVTFSSIASVLWSIPDFSVGNLYVQEGGSQLVVGIQSATNRNVFMTVVDVNGALVSQRLAYATAPSCTLYLSLSGLAQGMYFLRVSTAEGTVSTKPFLRL
jgi:lysophospholipase L1-like esterase